MSRSKLLVCLTAAVAASLALAPSALGNAWTVNSNGDENDDNPAGDDICETAPGNAVCTLRAAINEANNSADLDTITVQPNLGTIVVLSGIGIQFPTTIDGSGSGATAADTVIDGNADTVQPFQVLSGAATTTFKDLRIEDGRVTDDSGGAIRTGDTTTLDNVTIDSSTASSTSANVSGGAIRNTNSAATLTIQNSTISGNTAAAVSGSAANGGGVASSGPLVITNSVISGNTAAGNAGSLGAQGGGIAAEDFTITSSTIANNSVSGPTSQGAGIFSGANPGTRSITNSTVTGNTGTTDGGGGAHLNADTTITNVTFANNTGGNPNGDDLLQFSGTATVRNSIFDDTEACDDNSDNGTINSASPGHNIDLGISCDFPGAELNMDNTDPELTGATPFGGGHLIHIPLASPIVSPAIDNADPSCGGLTTDQRGGSRPQGGVGNCDIGAYERDYRDLNVTVAGSGTVTGPGINCVNNTGDCADEFLDGGPGDVLTATPAAGFQFSSWSAGGCSSTTGNQCTVDTGNDRMITATFTALPSSGGGTTTTPAPTPAKKKCKKGRKLKKGKCVKKKKRKK